MSLIEAIIGLMVMGILFAVLLTNFRSSHQHAVQTRNRAAAVLLAESFLDEIRAHDYGAVAPPHWPGADKAKSDFEANSPPNSLKSIAVAAEGIPQQMIFHQRLSYANSSFVDAKKKNNWDEVTLTLTWNETLGDSQDGLKGSRKVLTTSVLVRRPYAL